MDTHDDIRDPDDTGDEPFVPDSASPDSESPAPTTSRARPTWLVDLAYAAGAALLTVFLIWPVARQGFSFLDDGIWLVGAEQVKQGAALYRDVFTIYGPAKFVVLAAFLSVFGSSAATMVLLESIALGVAAGAGTFAARRLGAGRFALLVPLAVLALGVLKLKIVWAAVMTLLWGLGLRRGLDARSALALGLGWGALTWFGLDAAIHAAVVVGGSLGVRALGGRRESGRTIGIAAAGAAAMLAVPFVWAVATGSLDDFVWAAIVYPLAHFRAEMSVSLLATLQNVDLIGQPFSTLLTGESPEAQWPAHATLRLWSVRTLCGLVFVTPVLAIAAAWRRGRDPLLLALGLFGASSLASLVTRGDEQHLLGAALAAAWLTAVAIVRAPRILGAAAAVVAVAAFGPLLAETLWLATHADRDGLSIWDRDRAGVALATDRIQSLEESFGPIAAGNRVPTVFWPYAPGMNFVFDLPLGHKQITLLGGEVRDPGALVDELRTVPPRRMVLVRRFALEGRGMRDLAPELWGFIRTNYRVESTVVETDDPAWVLRPVYEGWDAVQQLPLYKRLPDKIQSTIDKWSPQLTGGTHVAQTFRVADADLSGLQIRWLSLSIGFTAPVEIVVWTVIDGELARPLHAFRAEVSFDEPQKTSLFTFPPVQGTMGREVAVEFRIPPEVQRPIHVMWHDHSGEDETDTFPGGTAMVDGVPVEADLYFATY